MLASARAALLLHQVVDGQHWTKRSSHVHTWFSPVVKNLAQEAADRNDLIRHGLASEALHWRRRKRDEKATADLHLANVALVQEFRKQCHEAVPAVRAGPPPGAQHLAALGSGTNGDALADAHVVFKLQRFHDEAGMVAAFREVDDALRASQEGVLTEVALRRHDGRRWVNPGASFDTTLGARLVVRPLASPASVAVRLVVVAVPQQNRYDVAVISVWHHGGEQLWGGLRRCYRGYESGGGGGGHDTARALQARCPPGTDAVLFSAWLGMQLEAAVVAMLAAGLLHGDLKADNVALLWPAAHPTTTIATVGAPLPALRVLDLGAALRVAPEQALMILRQWDPTTGFTSCGQKLLQAVEGALQTSKHGGTSMPGWGLVHRLQWEVPHAMWLAAGVRDPSTVTDHSSLLEKLRVMFWKGDTPSSSTVTTAGSDGTAPTTAHQ